MNSPLSIARKYCANFDESGCSGIDFEPDGKLVRFRSEGSRCLLAQNQPCSYFETAVLPTGESEEWKKADPGRAAEFAEGEDLYKRRHLGIPGLALKARKCPDCGKGIGPKQRYCVECRTRRRKETNSENQRKWQEKQGSP